MLITQIVKTDIRESGYRGIRVSGMSLFLISRYPDCLVPGPLIT